MSRTLLDKVWNIHHAGSTPFGEIVAISRHLVHEVTSPQAFALIRQKGYGVKYPERTFATVDHIIPTDDTTRPFRDTIADTMLEHLEQNTKEFGIPFFGLGHPNQGIVHVMAPELGLIQPGMTVVCGDSHTSTHGALGAIAFGIGTTEIACVLATGCMLMKTKPKIRRINVNGALSNEVTPKDVILYIINKLGVGGGEGYAYEYGGSVFDNMSMEGRMTVCNMSIEGGARCGYVNPDMTTVRYLEGREYITSCSDTFETLAERWLSFGSDPGAEYDDVVNFDAEDILPRLTWGTNPGESVSVDEPIPESANPAALKYMQFEAGETLLGKPINVAFIGSCTNGRIEDLRLAANFIENKGLKVGFGIKAIVVPGSARVAQTAEEEGLREIFEVAGWEWRKPGCSLCLAMNPDQLIGDQICASTSNRNFRGRQGSPTGRTLLMSPVMVAAAASEGKVTDVRNL
jgi:3-isopropylmalate/(R)-2-methylmalate dehydratase large subunit